VRRISLATSLIGVFLAVSKGALAYCSNPNNEAWPYGAVPLVYINTNMAANVCAGACTNWDIAYATQALLVEMFDGVPASIRIGAGGFTTAVPGAIIPGAIHVYADCTINPTINAGYYYSTADPSSGRISDARIALACAGPLFSGSLILRLL
jgi:hypothetical protein